MDRSLAFILGVFPMLFGSMFAIMNYCFAKGWLTKGQPSPANETFFITFVFAFIAGMYAMILVDVLQRR